MNILIPISKASSHIKSSPHPSLVKIAKDTNLIQFQLKTLGEIISNMNIYLFIDEYSQQIKDCVDSLKESQPINNKVHFVKKNFKSIPECIKTGLELTNNEECIVIAGNVIFNERAVKCLFNRKKSSFLMDNKNLFPRSDIGVWHEKGRIKHFSYSLPLKWTQLGFLSNEFIPIFHSFYKEGLLLHEILNKMVDIADMSIIQSKHAKAIEIKKPKDARLARQIFG